MRARTPSHLTTLGPLVAPRAETPLAGSSSPLGPSAGRAERIGPGRPGAAGTAAAPQARTIRLGLSDRSPVRAGTHPVLGPGSITPLTHGGEP